MTSGKPMTANHYTRLWFYRGKFRHFVAACYLGYRETGYGRCSSVFWTAINMAWVGWDRLWQ